MATAVTTQTFDAGGSAERDPGSRRLLGRVVWPLPCRLSGPRQDRRGASRRAQARQGEHRRERELSERYGIASIPTMILFKNGEPSAAVIGAQPKGAIERFSASPLKLLHPSPLSRKAGFAALGHSGCCSPVQGPGGTRPLHNTSEASRVDQPPTQHRRASPREAGGARPLRLLRRGRLPGGPRRPTPQSGASSRARRRRWETRAARRPGSLSARTSELGDVVGRHRRPPGHERSRSRHSTRVRPVAVLVHPQSRERLRLDLEPVSSRTRGQASRWDARLPR